MRLRKPIGASGLTTALAITRINRWQVSLEKGNLLQDIPYRKGTADFQAAEEQERMKKIIFSCVVLVLCIFSALQG